ncbi:MAG: glycosyltransferase family 4 protein [Firmicutes bacterium]|nr:glycosyltransferase family 4 protein [Bacillota bacterium]
MKILFLINKAGGGGSERFVLDLAEELKGRGIGCVLACGLEGPLADRARAAGIKTVKLEMERRDFFSAPQRIAELCRSEAIDVIHAQFPRENLYALRSLKHYDRPKVVWTCHWYQDQGIKWRLINKACAKKLFAAAAVYEGGMQILKANGIPADKVCFINNGVKLPVESVPVGPAAETTVLSSAETTESQAAGPDPDVFECCVLSRYSPEKGLDMLLDSIKLLDPDKPFRCTICGDGELYGYIGNRIKTEGLEGRVVQAGYLMDASPVLQRSQLFLSPSYKEGLSLGLLEALAAGLPCVVTDTGASRSVAEDDPRCGICVKPGDAKAFAAAIKQYMNDKDLRLAHSKAAREKSQKYSVRRMADEYIRLYEYGPGGITGGQHEDR